GLTALGRWQRITRAPQEHSRAGRTNLHLAAAGRALDVSARGLVGPHPLVRRLSLLQLATELCVERVQNTLPVFSTGRDLVEALLHFGGKAVVHQVLETFSETISDDVSHLFRIKAPVLQLHIT